MPDPEANRSFEPFYFFTRLNLHELTGLKARNLQELLSHLKEVPGSVIYYHTHHFLQQHQYLSPEPPNDFAYWVTEVLQEKKLGEKLASINTVDYDSIRSLREKMIATIETHSEKAKAVLTETPEGEEFHFIKSVSFVLPTSYVAYNLEEFLAILKKITIHSIYFHMFEAKLRLEKGKNDFSLWFESALGESELAKKISRLDPYTHTMEGLRDKISRLIEKRLANQHSEVSKEI